MPTYEYRCPEGHEFELFQRMSDPPVALCPTCGLEAARQLSTGAGFLFKGEGFYITDYRSAEYKKKAEAESGGPKKAGGESKAGGASKAGSGEGASSSGGSAGSTPANKD
jgi:putative FmdB family regulatory protein